MIQPLRPYQQNAVVGVHNEWQEHRCVLLVAPTGAGKTRLAEEFIFRARAAKELVLFVVHRRELLQQAAGRFRERFGRLEVGIIAPGEELNLACPIQVATVQTLLARDERPTATLVIADEAHHYEADDWGKLLSHYSSARLLGLTATPERQDGRPLGDTYTSLVVAARYPELVRDGFLVPAKVFQPPEQLDSRELAQDPLLAYQRFGDNGRAFIFCGAVSNAYDVAKQFRDAEISAETIEAKTKKVDRDAILQRFASGETRVLTNVYALTEGVDVPAASVCILARNVAHVGSYLQMVGRVLRPAPGKTEATIIDLTGATLQHGMPTEDRIYSLDGEGIRRTSVAPLRNCPECGATVFASLRTCPECGHTRTIEQHYGVRVYDLELRAVFAGADTPSMAKEREYRRLRAYAKERGWGIGWVVLHYRKQFREAPDLSDATADERRAEYDRLRDVQVKKGFKPGFVGVRYKDLFGAWPPRAWALPKAAS